ncbi:MAG: cobalamin-dependent protein [Calditrichaceae bacterium]|nr:cobalamin-dependent protein [Calditrichaceae bacterium]
MKNKILLINPWIYDFSAFDLWSKPLGLLYIASFLREHNFDVFFIDCLDKYSGHDSLKVKFKKYGTGHFHREIIEKPKILGHIPKSFARYGMTEDVFIAQLKSHKNVQAILVTSLMTYWYLGVKRVVELCRQYLPGVPVILGGIYASLLPDHARKEIKPDYLIEGPGEIKVLNLLKHLLNKYENSIDLPKQLDDYPCPAFDLINHPDYLIILTARGCPYNCTFCAQKLISMPFSQRNPDTIIEEFELHYQSFKLRDFAFYDDALFINKSRHINVILEKLIEKQLPLRLHSPNGLFANAIDAELARLMFRANFTTLRLSFETFNNERRKDMFSKVSNEGMINAVYCLTSAGFNASDLEAYVLMGLPNQSIEEVIGSIVFVNNLGVMVRLASFSPIPGTVEFDRAVESGIICKDIDPLLTNNSIFPLTEGDKKFVLFQKIKSFCTALNKMAEENKLIYKDTSIETTVTNVMRKINE